MTLHLKPSVNGITDQQLEGLRDIAIGHCITRDDHNFWFETNASQQVIDDLCTEFNLVQVIE